MIREAIKLQVPYASMVWLSIIPKLYFWCVFLMKIEMTFLTVERKIQTLFAQINQVLLKMRDLVNTWFPLNQ